MNSRHRAAALLAAALAFGTVGEAWGQARYKTGAWIGAANFRGQQFTHCDIGRRYSDGLSLLIQLTAPMVLYVGATKTEWNLDPSQTYDVAFELTGYRKTHRGRVNGVYRNTIWFELGNDVELRRAIAAGGSMTWTDARGTRFVFDLDGGDNAMRKLLACTALFGVE